MDFSSVGVAGELTVFWVSGVPKPANEGILGFSPVGVAELLVCCVPKLPKEGVFGFSSEGVDADLSSAGFFSVGVVGAVEEGEVGLDPKEKEGAD